MKINSFFLTLFVGATLACAPARAQDGAIQDSTGLPGDHFSLQGALEMFKKAGSPEEFEKLLNTESNGVNNLDLNHDGEIDYIKVIDKKEGDIHAFILRVPVAAAESQDVAVIELEKTGTDKAMVQIVGDEDLYGEQTVVEPFEEGEETSYVDAEASEVAHGPHAADAWVNTGAVIVNVWAWPCVRFVYAPAYAVWVSPWGWRHMPGWWRPWRPLHRHAFYTRRVVYHNRYVVVHTHRAVRAHRVYAPGRVTSATVRTRNQVTVNHYRANRVQATRRTTTVERSRGKVKVERTRTTVRKRKR
jgi:hypothetical protein